MQFAYARCDGQLARFAAGTASHRADDDGRLLDGDGADNCGLRSFANPALSTGVGGSLQKTMVHAGLWLILVILLRLPLCPPSNAHIAVPPATKSDRGHEGVLRCSALIAEGFRSREPLGRSSWT